MLWIWVLFGFVGAMALRSFAVDRVRERYVRAELAAPEWEGAWPAATVIVPVKGDDEGLRENLGALAGLDYPDFELIVVARAGSDVPGGVIPEKARVVIAGEWDAGTGEKINNLLAAIANARAESEVLAFADSDGRVQRGWLRALVRGLDRKGVGAATGYRWHVPERPGFWPLMRSVWNSVIAGEFGTGQPMFAWGGAMAIRREVFERIGVRQFWKGSVSDDYALSAAVRAAELEIAFAPGAFVASTDGTGGGEFLRWIRRQMLITRVYRPRLWVVGFVAHAIYCAAYVAAVWLLFAGDRVGLYALLVILGLGAWRGMNRRALGKLLLPEYAGWFRRNGWAYAVLDALSTWVWLYSFLASASTNEMEWRGVRYRISAQRVERR